MQLRLREALALVDGAAAARGPWRLFCAGCQLLTHRGTSGRHPRSSPHMVCCANHGVLLAVRAFHLRQPAARALPAALQRADAAALPTVPGESRE